VIPKETNPVSDQAELRALGTEFLKQCVERTAELGARLICGPLCPGPGVMTGKRRTQDEWKWAAESLGVAARRGRKLGVTLCIEPLNRFETYFLNTLGDAAELIHFIAEPNVRIHFDTFHANIEERNLSDSILGVGKYLGHVHVSENDLGIPGTGHVDWRGTFSALKESGYEQWITIESFAQPEPEPAAAIWRDLAPSGDELASQGLAFIKTMSRECGNE
jgi:D-psicose/D-tagatose/L-ribulose 3-epimerase